MKHVDDRRPWLIGLFPTIGWSDPFPEEDLAYDPLGTKYKFTKTDLDNLEVDQPCYAPSRYIKGQSPHMLWIPKRELLVKLMRASVCVKNKYDLWFNRRLSRLKWTYFPEQIK